MFTAGSYEQFQIENVLSIVEGKGKLPLINVNNEHATAQVSIYGAQVLSYVPNNAQSESGLEDSNDLFFVSESAYFEEGKAIKGGIPICWPWFGKDVENPEKQMHGFARNMLWQLDDTSLDEGNTIITLSLSDSNKSQQLWPHSFTLTLKITIGKTLSLALSTLNTGPSAFKITQALHAYFSVADIDHTEIEGLTGVKYLDKVTNAKHTQTQRDTIKVRQEVDRIYINTPQETTLHDFKRDIKTTITTQGSQTTIVWNPWIDISKNSGDLTDDAYQSFVCIETANAANDFIVVEPNESYKIEAEYLTEAL